MTSVNLSSNLQRNRENQDVTLTAVIHVHDDGPQEGSVYGHVIFIGSHVFHIQDLRDLGPQTAKYTYRPVKIGKETIIAVFIPHHPGTHAGSEAKSNAIIQETIR